MNRSAAVGVERFELGAGERGGLGPNNGMRAIRERVLEVELQPVDLERRQRVDPTVERLHRGDLVPADVQHDAALGEVGGVLDRQRGDPARHPVEADELVERTPCVERARGIPRLDDD